MSVLTDDDKSRKSWVTEQQKIHNQVDRLVDMVSTLQKSADEDRASAQAA